MTGNKQFTKLLSLSVFFLLFDPLFSQSKFSPEKLFAELSKKAVTAYPSANGAPGIFGGRIDYCHSINVKMYKMTRERIMSVQKERIAVTPWFLIIPEYFPIGC